MVRCHESLLSFLRNIWNKHSCFDNVSLCVWHDCCQQGGAQSFCQKNGLYVLPALVVHTIRIRCIGWPSIQSRDIPAAIYHASIQDIILLGYFQIGSRNSHIVSKKYGPFRQMSPYDPYVQHSHVISWVIVKWTDPLELAKPKILS